MRHLLRLLLGGVVSAALAVAPASAGVVLTHHNGAGASPGAMYTPPDFTGCNFTTPTTFTHTWYIDPVHGQTQNVMTTAGVSLDPTVTPHQGDATHPWKDLNAVAISKFNVVAGLTGYPAALLTSPQGTAGPIHAGDLILLESGTAAQYGAITIGDSGLAFNANASYLTIKPDTGATVTFSVLAVQNISNIHISGVNVQASGKIPLFKTIQQNGGVQKNVVLDNLSISATDAATARTWTQAQWGSLISNGVVFGIGSCVSMSNSHIFNVASGVAYSGATPIKFQNNEIDHVTGDGIDFHGDDLLITGNYIHDFVNDLSGEHIDGMQGVIGLPSAPISHRVLIDSNTVVTQADPNLEFAGSGFNGAIGTTNNPWVNLYITNNKIYWANFSRAVAVEACTNCAIENNTLAGGFVSTLGGDVNVIVKNNLAGGLGCATSDTGVQMQNNVLYKGASGDIIICFNGQTQQMSGGNILSGIYLGNNKIDTGGVLSEITTLDLTNFVYDFHLLSTAPARGFGTAVDFTPAVDSLGNALNSPPDVGAIQFSAGNIPPPTTADGAFNYATACSGGSCLMTEDTFTESSLNTSFWNNYQGDGAGSRWNDQGNLGAPYSAISNCPSSSCASSNTYEYGDPYNYGFGTQIDTAHMSGGGGILSLTAAPSTHFSANGYHWAGAYISSGGHSAMMCPATGCYIQVRAKSPDRRYGAWPAIWMLPGTSGTGGAEFDIADGAVNGNTTTANFSSTSKWWGCNGVQHDWTTPGDVDVTAAYHVYGFQYIPNTSFTTYFDGAQMATFSLSGCTVNANFELILSAQVAGPASSGFYPQPDGVHNGPFTWNINDVQIYNLP